MELRLLADADYAEEFGVAENELIDQYLANDLPAEERTQFEQYFLAAPERRDKLAFATTLAQAAAAHAAEKRPAPVFTPAVKRRAAWPAVPASYLKIAAVLIVALGLGLGGWLLFVKRPAEDRALAALGDAYKHQRFIEARIAGLAHAPLVVTRGEGSPGVDVDTLRLEETRLLTGLKERPDAAAHHALGRFYLAGARFDEAIRNLEKAAGQEPGNAQIHSDLGAALLEKGKAETAAPESGEALKYFARSRDESGKALDLDASLLEALYNRAIARQHLLMWQLAEDDWRKYLERDSDSPWAAEAKKNLKLLEERRSRAGQRRRTQGVEAFLAAYSAGEDEVAWKIYTSNHASAGNAITNALLDSYLDSQAGGAGGGDDDKARRSIEALSYLGDEEVRRVGDRYTSDLAQFYGSTTPERRFVLRRARGLIKEGYRLAGKAQFAKAIDSFAAARQDFAQVGDTVEAVFADCAIAHCYAIQPDIPKGLSIFARISPVCESRNYRWLLAQCLRTTAHLRHNLNEYSKAIDSSARALSLSEQVEDTDGLLRSLTQLAALHESLKDTEKSLGYLLRSLVIGQEYDSAPKDMWGSYVAMSFNFVALGYYGAALDYQSEALRLAVATDIPFLLSRSHEYLGQTYAKLKLYDDAIRSARAAYEQGEALVDKRLGLNAMASTSLQLGDIHRQAGDHARAVEAYDRSIGLYDELEFYHHSSSARKGRLISHLARGNDALAAEELRAVLRIFEDYREKITEERLRNIFFDNEQGVYDLAIDFEFSKMNDPRRAFDYSEQSRARSLLALVRAGGGGGGGRSAERERARAARPPDGAEPTPFAQVQAGMPAGAQLLQFAVLEDKLLVWLLSKEEFFYKAVPVDSKALDDLVAAYLKDVTGPSDADAEAARKNSRALHDLLIKPLEDRLVAGKLLCVVPDKVLNYVPFDALVSAETGRYLVEDYALTLAPSATIFGEASAAAAAEKGRLAKRDETLLSVGDPSFDRRDFPRLARLPSAAREAAEVAAYYKTPRVLLREQARARPVKAGLGKANVAHLAAHYVVERGPEVPSKLALAREPSGAAQEEDAAAGAGGALEPWEVYRMELPLTRLVVLSGCQTGIERQYDGEGAISFARPFIAAGVPLVVASLWPVDSDATTELMISFHRHRKCSSLTTAQALRAAQLEMIKSPDPRYRRPYYWAPFVAIGGHTDF